MREKGLTSSRELGSFCFLQLYMIPRNDLGSCSSSRKLARKFTGKKGLTSSPELGSFFLLQLYMIPRNDLGDRGGDQRSCAITEFTISLFPAIPPCPSRISHPKRHDREREREGACACLFLNFINFLLFYKTISLVFLTFIK